MIRALVMAIAALAASACSYGSVVDMAPMSARLASPALGPGGYCEVERAVAPIAIASQDCTPISWNGASRTYAMKDEDEAIDVAPVALGEGLYLAQVEETQDRPDRYQLFLFLSRGDALALLPALEDEPLQKLAARHARITFRPGRSGRLYIAAGEPSDIRAFLKDAARQVLRTMQADGEALSIGVRSAPGAIAPTQGQIRDIQAILKAATSFSD